jgi:hypothetical protein
MTHIHTVIKLIPDSVEHVRSNGLQCMRYPITKFLDERGQWWHINTVCNEPPQTKKSHGVTPGERGGQGRRLLSPFAALPIQSNGRTRLRSTRTLVWKWGEVRPIVECNRHNSYSVGVTTSFPTCPEMSLRSQLLRWSRGTPHRKCWLLESHAGSKHCVCWTCDWCGMWLHRRRSAFLRNHLAISGQFHVPAALLTFG